jgi:hypothetical protein
MLHTYTHVSQPIFVLKLVLVDSKNFQSMLTAHHSWLAQLA